MSDAELLSKNYSRWVIDLRKFISKKYPMMLNRADEIIHDSMCTSIIYQEKLASFNTYDRAGFIYGFLRADVRFRCLGVLKNIKYKRTSSFDDIGTLDPPSTISPADQDVICDLKTLSLATGHLTLEQEIFAKRIFDRATAWEFYLQHADMRKCAEIKRRTL